MLLLSPNRQLQQNLGTKEAYQTMYMFFQPQLRAESHKSVSTVSVSAHARNFTLTEPEP